MKDNIEKFKDLFIEYEQLTKKKVKNKVDLKMAQEELRKKRIEPYYSEYDFLDFCRFCRNREFHTKDDSKYIKYTDEFINKFTHIINQIKNPPTAYEKSTKTIKSAQCSDSVRRIMEEMVKYNYTHIPVYDNNKLIGIFSENAIFNYLLNNNIVLIEQSTTFNEIRDCISLSNSNEIVKFISKKKLYNDVINEFIEEFKKGKKLSCFMITEDGNTDKKVIGIITSWDIIGRKE